MLGSAPFRSPSATPTTSRRGDLTEKELVVVVERVQKRQPLPGACLGASRVVSVDCRRDEDAFGVEGSHSGEHVVEDFSEDAGCLEVEADADDLKVPSRVSHRADDRNFDDAWVKGGDRPESASLVTIGVDMSDSLEDETANEVLGFLSPRGGLGSVPAFEAIELEFIRRRRRRRFQHAPT